jgi:hypothetical protein
MIEDGNQQDFNSIPSPSLIFNSQPYFFAGEQTQQLVEP